MIAKSGDSATLGNYVVLEDAYGNRYTYAELGQIVRHHRTVVMPTGNEKRVPVDSAEHPPAALRAAGPGRRRAPRRSPRPKHGSTATRRPGGADGTLKVGSKVIAGHRAGPDRRRRRRRRPPHQLLDPAGRQGRAADRPEADPRRLEAARGDGDLPRQRQEPASPPTSAAPASCCSPRRRCSSASSPTRASRSTNAAAPTSPPARSTAASWRCSSTWSRRASS